MLVISCVYIVIVIMMIMWFKKICDVPWWDREHRTSRFPWQVSRDITAL